MGKIYNNYKGIDIIFLPTLSNKILKILNKIHTLFRRIERNISGLHSATIMDLFLSIIAYKEED